MTATGASRLGVLRPDQKTASFDAGTLPDSDGRSVSCVALFSNRVLSIHRCDDWLSSSQIQILQYFKPGLSHCLCTSSLDPILQSLTSLHIPTAATRPSAAPTQLLGDNVLPLLPRKTHGLCCPSDLQPHILNHPTGVTCSLDPGRSPRCRPRDHRDWQGTSDQICGRNGPWPQRQQADILVPCRQLCSGGAPERPGHGLE